MTKTHTFNQLARLAGVSARTLHHYDEIGLLRPAFTGENRYRYYGEDELLRLQQILIHRELDTPHRVDAARGGNALEADLSGGDVGSRARDAALAVALRGVDAGFPAAAQPASQSVAFPAQC